MRRALGPCILALGLALALGAFAATALAAAPGPESRPESRPAVGTASVVGTGGAATSVPETPGPAGALAEPEADADGAEKKGEGKGGKKGKKGDDTDEGKGGGKKAWAARVDLGDYGVLEFRGRALGRLDLRSERGGAWTSDLALDSARTEVRYEWRDALRVVLEVELAGGPRVFDAYVRGRWRFLGLRAGHFKPPFSAIQLESRWTLPVLERGLMGDFLLDGLGVAGRRPGLQAEVAGKGALDPKLHVGLFQPSDSVGLLLDEAGLGLFKVDGRASISPGGVEIGVFGEARPAEPISGAGYEWFWAAGVDVTWSKKFDRHALRVWGDAVFGSTWADDDPFDMDHDLFFGGRAIVAWRYGGLDGGDWYVEPFGLFAAVDPELEIVDDLLWEIAAGVNAGLWDRARLTLGFERRHTSRNVPLSLGLYPVDEMPPFDDTRILLQIGAAF